MGRGDRRGATRLACFLFALLAIEFIFREHFGSVLRLVGAPLVYWLVYIAFEPFVRRHWSGMLVGWSRLIAGSFRDPLVGRDLLIGCAAGVTLSMLSYSGVLLASLFSAPQPAPSTGIPVGTIETLSLFSGTRSIVVGIVHLMSVCIIYALLITLLLFLLRTLLRSTWAAAIICILVFAAAFFPAGKMPLVFLIPVILMPVALSSVIHLLIMFRFGLLALIADQFFYNLLCLFPITTQTSAWYFGIGLTGLVILLAMAFYAFHTSLGGQPLFGRASLED